MTLVIAVAGSVEDKSLPWMDLRPWFLYPSAAAAAAAAATALRGSPQSLYLQSLYLQNVLAIQRVAGKTSDVAPYGHSK